MPSSAAKPPRPSRGPRIADAESSEPRPLLSTEPRLLARHPPAARPGPAPDAALDVIVWEKTLMVAYAVEGGAVVVARGADLATMALLRAPDSKQNGFGEATALSFCQADASLAVAFGGAVVTFTGWYQAQTVKTSSEGSPKYSVLKLPEVEKPRGSSKVPSITITSLSFSNDGRRFAVVGPTLGVSVFQKTAAASSTWTLISNISFEAVMGKLSPDGSLIAVAGLYARIVRVWRLTDEKRVEAALASTTVRSPPSFKAMRKTYSGQTLSLSEIVLPESSPLTSVTDQRKEFDSSAENRPSPYAELGVGRSGVNSLSWKPRGGGQPVLLTTDRDGSLRLWAKIPRIAANAPTAWMEEIARTPHFSGTHSSAADFVSWGGGGGVAVDEADARATSALYPFLAQGSVPKPSRTSHWIVAVAGGGIAAWQARGLDDRPRAAYARLEPGPKNSTLMERAMSGSRQSSTSFEGQKRSVRTALTKNILTVRTVAPEPLTLTSQETDKLVRSYAISNAEKSLRSPEPPTPPPAAAAFIMAVNDGQVSVSRWDLCPTSDSVALCRAKVGEGHMGYIVDIQVAAGSGSIEAAASGGRGRVTAASVGVHGDIILWRTDSSSVLKPLAFGGRLPGPHSAVAFPELSISDEKYADLFVAADPIRRSLHVYRTKRNHGKSSSLSTKPIRVASAVELKRISKLQLIPDTTEDVGNQSHQIALGLFEQSDRLGVWRLSCDGGTKAVELKRAMLSIDGSLVESRVTSFAVSERGENFPQQQACIVLGRMSGHVQICQLAASKPDRILIREVKVLGNRTADDCGPVCSLAVGKHGLRVAVIRENGFLTVWEKNSSSGRWKRELHRRVCNSKSAVRSIGQSRGSQVAFGTDPLGHTYLAVACGDPGRRHVELFIKKQGVAWCGITSFGEQELHQVGTTARMGSCLAFTGPGVLALSDGLSLLTFSTTCASMTDEDDGSILAVVPDLFKSTGRSSFIHTGGSALQALAILRELHGVVRNAYDNLDQDMQAANHGYSFSLSPPPPPLAILLARGSALEKLTQETASFDRYGELADHLKDTNIKGLSKANREGLLAFARGAANLGTALNSLDKCGASFALAASTLLASSDESKVLPEAVFAEALHSTAKDALVDLFVQQGNKEQGMWEKCRRLGCGFWLNTAQYAKKLAEKVARTAFAKSQDPDDAALWYICLGRRSALAALYRAKNQTRMYQFLVRNFKESENRVAAEKNAYVLVSKRRYELAAAFFALGGNAAAAANLLLSRSCDPQLAIVVARLLDNFGELRNLSTEQSSSTEHVLNHIVAESVAQRKDHQKALAESLLGKHDEALVTAASSFEVSDEGDLSVDVIDGELVGVLTLGHVFAICSRPPHIGTAESEATIFDCRMKAGASLAAEGYPSAALAVFLDSIKSLSAEKTDKRVRVERATLDVMKSCMKQRALLHSQASAGNGKRMLHDVLKDLEYLIRTSGLQRQSVLQATKIAAVELGLYDETDASIILSMASCGASEPSEEEGNWNSYEPLEDVISIASSRALEIVEVNLFRNSLFRTGSFFSTPARQYQRFRTVLRACQGVPESVRNVLQHAIGNLRRTSYVLRICNGFISGHWMPIARNLPTLLEDMGTGLYSGADEEDIELEGRNQLLNAAGSLEDLRKVASSPAALTLSNRGVSRKAIRKSLSQLQSRRLFMQSPSGGSSPVSSSPAVTAVISPSGSIDQGLMGPLSLEEEPLPSARHFLMNHTLGVAAVCTAAAHVAHVVCRHHNWSSEFVNRFRFAAEHFEASAVDALHGWCPLVPFGTLELQPRYHARSVESYGTLWRMLCSIGEFSSVMSEAATVAAAAESWAREEAAVELRKGSRKKKKNRLQGEDAIDSYPVRFSSSSTGPWSGQGKHMVIHQEERELIRSLCVSSSDPPVIVIATPRGINEVTPSSYLFRQSAPGSPRTSFEGASELGRRVNITKLEQEIPYAAMLGSAGQSPASRHEPASVWRNRAESTAVASHPHRRRFASGGQDGVVMLWGHGEAVPVGELHQHRPKINSRVATLKYSAYAESLLGVYVSGQVVIWHDPDHQAAGSGLRRRSTSGGSYRIEAFGNRRASDGVFLDERNVVAVVGDPGGVTSAGAHAVGHSLRVFDLREPGTQTSQPRATWTARVHAGTEARCLSLLEDRMRIVTGGVDGTLSIVDTRARACIAEQLPAHDEEVVCMTLEQPRGRALATGCHGGKIRLWDSRTLMSLDTVSEAHTPTRHFWSGGSGLGGLVGGIHGVKSLHLTDRALMSCGGDGAVKIWGPGWGDFDHLVL